ncbi:SusC/RagA family TonB-linked outer membrane protein [Flavobacterium sp. RHBU_3]|uniref:SusC/RagA family TonB-linked outer membrane protein n=1 Tax=Flavobacterium sp. RHBU_3 TaxID=3391184 RepID=UPI0039853EC0
MGNKLHKVTKWCTQGKALFYLMVLCFAGTMHAQQKVSGVVSDEKGMTIPGVNVTVKGAQGGVVTNLEGEYAIEVPENGTLVFSFIGFTTEEVAVKGRTSINVKMTETAKTLDEVVVIGYGSQKKDDVNSAVSSIRSKDLENIKQTSVDQMLQGKAAGVSVTNGSGQPGSAASVHIRGITSISGTNEPLYVIDGVPVSGDATGKSTSGRPVAGSDFSSTGGAGNNTVSPISFINPNDIESIDILKDASATAIYGSRGANGVIIITTKSGKKGTGKMAYEGYTSVGTIYKKLDVMNLRQYAQQQNQLSLLYGIPEDQLRPEFAHPELLGNGTDWQDAIYQTAKTQSHQLSFSGAKDGTNYYISGGFINQDGILLGSGFKRYTMRANVDSKVKDWLRVGTNMGTGITNEQLTINQSYTGIISNALLQAPDIPVRNPDGSFAGPLDNSLNATYFNPVGEAMVRDNKLVRKNFMGSVYGEATLLDGLKYRAELGANTEFADQNDFLPTYYWGVQTHTASELWKRGSNWYAINLKNLLTYDKTIGQHKFTVLLGQEANDSHWEGLNVYSSDAPVNDPATVNLGSTIRVTANDYYKGSAAIYSLFARVIYDFNNRFGMSASVRGDRSSKFDPNGDGGKKQWGYFPAISGSWKISNEKFMESTKDYIDNLKLRIGYGETGNQQLPNNRYTALLQPGASGLGSSYTVANSPNPDLTWESMKQTNIGLDFTLFNSRLTANVDYFIKKSEGFLFQVPLPDYLTGGDSYYGGIAAPWSNLGSMENRGYDITLSYNTKGTGDFSYNSSLVFSHYTNKLTDLQSGLTLTQQVNTNGYIPMVATNTVVNQPVGMFYGYVAEGLFTSTDQLNSAPIQFGQSVGTGAGQTWLGDVKYKDISGPEGKPDGVIDTYDKTFIGNPNPKFTFGFTNNFKYKNFDLSIFLQGSVGNDVMNLTRRNGTLNAQLYVNQLSEAANYWTEENPNTSVPRPIGDLSNPNVQISNRYIEDGSYLRIQNTTLGYTLPSEIASKIKMSRVRVYATGTNLHTFTKYTGYDPEIGSFNQNVLLTGIDNGRYPSPRTYSFGVNLEF